MKRLAVAVAAVALSGAGPTAQQAAQSERAKAPAALHRLALSQSSTMLRTGPSTAARSGSSTKPPANPKTKAPAGAPTALSVDSQNQLVKQYCAGCHSERGKAGGLTLAGFDAAKIEEHGDVAEKMIRKLRTGMMPPPNAKRPEAAVVKSFIDTLEHKIDAAAALSPNPGWRPFQRLNRAEYQRTVRDLVGIDVDVTAFLPPDTISRGFDNVADVQNFSPTLMESYLRAASQISRLAVGDRNASPTSVTYKIGRTASQMRHVEGAPMGTRGGTSVVHTFPADGEYVIKMSMHNEPLGGIYGRTTMATMDIKEQVEVSVNGERAALVDLNVRMSETDPKNSLEIRTPPIHIAAGPQRISAAFIQRFDGPLDDLLVPLENTLADVNISFGVTALPHMRDMTILGPSSVTGVSDTVSRRMIFTCRPTSAKEEETCAADIVKRLATQAYRGVATPDDLQDAMLFYDQGRKKGDFESGIRMALQSILVSPRFLFRLEQAPQDVKAVKAARTYRVSDQDLASRLSFFIWGTAPDAELIKAAGAGTLRTTAGLEKQVRRMLADRRSEALATRFAGQWLRLQDLEKIHPDYLVYPQYDDTLAQAMQRETELFFDSLVREDRPVLDLLDGRLHLRERAAGEALQPAERHGKRLPPRADAGVPPRHLRPRQHPDAHIRGGPDLAGAARQVGHGSAARVAAAAAAAQRAVARGRESGDRRQAALDPRAHGRAPEESRVHVLPPGHRSARPGAREFRRDRRVAHQGQRSADRLGRRPVRRDEDGRAGGAAAGDREARRRLSPELHREPDDLRARPPGRVRRHAGDSRDRSRRGPERQPHVVVRARRREQRGIPDGECRTTAPDH